MAAAVEGERRTYLQRDRRLSQDRVRSGVSGSHNVSEEKLGSGGRERARALGWSTNTEIGLGSCSRKTTLATVWRGDWGQSAAGYVKTS